MARRGVLFQWISIVSKAPKQGYARTPTADGGFQYTYRGLRLAPGLPAVMGVLPAVIIFVLGAFGTPFGFPLFIALLIYAFVFIKFVNKIDRTITIYPDRIVTYKGQTIAFRDITHLGWETSAQSTRFIDGSFLKAQALGVVYNVSGFTTQATATGLQNEAKQISEISYT